MSTPKLIKVISSSAKSQNNKQTCASSANFGRSSMDSLPSQSKTSYAQNYYPLLIDQVKKLSKDNDRLWNLLTQSEDQNVVSSRIQKKLKENLQNAEKQLLMTKQMYFVEKTNFQQSNLFYEKREKQWQEIVSDLKKVIDDYQYTQSIDLNQASKIFNQTPGMKSPSSVDQLVKFDGALSIYSRRPQNQRQSSELDDTQRRSKQISSSELQSSEIKYDQSNIPNKGSALYGGSSRIHRSKLFKSKNSMTLKNMDTKSAKKMYEKIYNQEMTKLQYYSMNPEHTYELLTSEDVFERALLRTYINYRNNQGMKAIDILSLAHMEKLKTAKSSTKQRLIKTIKKVFIVQSNQELEDVIKFIEDKVYKKYRLLKGQLAFGFLEQKFFECQQVFESSNSALQKFDRQPTNIIHGARMNSKFKQFQQKKKDLRSSNSLRNVSQMGKDHDDELKSVLSRQSYGLNINSNIKDIKDKKLHSNNHMTRQDLSPNQTYERDISAKNIYTEKRSKRLNELKASRSQQNAQLSTANINLSSLIGSHEYETTSKDLYYRCT